MWSEQHQQCSPSFYWVSAGTTVPTLGALSRAKALSWKSFLGAQVSPKVTSVNKNWALCLPANAKLFCREGQDSLWDSPGVLPLTRKVWIARLGFFYWFQRHPKGFQGWKGLVTSLSSVFTAGQSFSHSFDTIIPLIPLSQIQAPKVEEEKQHEGQIL